MRVVAEYSFNQGSRMRGTHSSLVDEVVRAIERVDALDSLSKVSKEKTMYGARLYSPRSLNDAFKHEFTDLGWTSLRVRCDYSTDYYLDGYTSTHNIRPAFREMDFVKDRVGVEIQFGKYAFMVYNVCAKMTIFRNLGWIDVGVEIVPVKAFVRNMSTGVSYFEQFVWDLENRGVSDIDIPVMILGIDS